MTDHNPQPSPVRLVLALGLGQIIAFASSFYLMGAIGDDVARDLRIPAGLVFGLVSASFAVPAFVAPAVARRIDRGGGKPVLLAAHLVFAAALLMIAAAPGPWSLTAGMLTLGFGMALGLSPTPFAILVALHGEDARRPITAVALIGGLGSAVGWPLTAWMAEQHGWRGACLVWAALHLMLALPLAAWATPDVKAARPKAVQGEGAAVVWDRAMVQLAVLFACAWFVSTCMSAHLPRLLAAFGLSLPQATAAAGLMGVAAVTVRLLEFTVLRRLSPLVTTRIATLMHPVGAAGLLALGGQGAAALAIGQGAGNGMLTVAKGVLPLRLYGPDNYAYRSALLGRPALFAQIGGPALYGLALARSPGFALAVSSALCLVMFAMTFGLAPGERKPRALIVNPYPRHPAL